MIRKITIDELHSMSQKELDEYIDYWQKLVEDGLVSEDESNIDFMGLTDDEIVEKYGYVEMNEFVNGLYQRFADKYGEDWGKIH